MALQEIILAERGRTKRTPQQSTRSDLIAAPGLLNTHSYMCRWPKFITQESLDIIRVILGQLIKLDTGHLCERTVSISVKGGIGDYVDPDVLQTRSEFSKSFSIF